jgi:hypothetical protein
MEKKADRFSLWDYIIIAIAVAQGLIKLPDLLRIPYGSFVIFLLSGFIAFLLLYGMGRRGMTVWGNPRSVIKPQFKNAAMVGIATGILTGLNFALETWLYTNPLYALFTGIYLPTYGYLLGIGIFFLIPFVGSILSFLAARYLFRAV